MAFVRSFAHTNSGHSGGTHYVMTGYDHRLADKWRCSETSVLVRFSRFAFQIIRKRNANFVRLGRIYADGPAFFGNSVWSLRFWWRSSAERWL